MKKRILFFLLIIFIYPLTVLAFDDQQIKAGNYTDLYIVGTEVLLHNDEVQECIEEIGNRIINAAIADYPEIAKIEFKFRIINSPDINASATSGGFFYINTGLLEFAQSKDEIASVIGHEISHLVRNHYIKKFKKIDRTAKIIGAVAYVGATAGKIIAEDASGDYSYQTRSAFVNAGVNIGGALAGITGLMLGKMMLEGYEQEQELQADLDGWRFAERAEFNSRAMIALFKRLQYKDKKSENIKKNYMSRLSNKKKHRSHLFNAKPGLEARINQLEQIPLKN